MIYVALLSVPGSARDKLKEIHSFRTTFSGKEFSKLPNPVLPVGSLDQCLSIAEHLENAGKELRQNIADIRSAVKSASISLEHSGDELLADKLGELLQEQPLDPQSNALSIEPFAGKEVSLLVEEITTELKTANSNIRELLQSITDFLKQLGEVKGLISGPLTTCSLVELLPKNALVQGSSCLESLIFVVPRVRMTEWMNSYETLAPFVVPTSATEIVTDDKEFTLMTVVVFSKYSKQFIDAARGKGFIHRSLDEGVYTRSHLISREKELLHSLAKAISRVGFEYKRFVQKIFRASYLRLYTESILRFGLPSAMELFHISSLSSEECSQIRLLFNKLSTVSSSQDTEFAELSNPIVIEFMVD